MHRCDSASVGKIWFKGHAVRTPLLTPRVFLGLQHAGPHPVVLFSSLLSTGPQGPVGNAADTRSAAEKCCDAERQLRRGEGAPPPPYLGRALPRRPRFSIYPRVKAERELSVD